MTRLPLNRKSRARGWTLFYLSWIGLRHRMGLILNNDRCPCSFYHRFSNCQSVAINRLKWEQPSRTKLPGLNVQDGGRKVRFPKESTFFSFVTRRALPWSLLMDDLWFKQQCQSKFEWNAPVIELKSARVRSQIRKSNNYHIKAGKIG